MIWSTLPASTGGSLTNLEKTWKPGRADVDVLGLDAFFGEHRPAAPENQLFPRGFLRAFQAERLDGKIIQPQAARLVDFKLRQLEAAGPEINGQK